jgi:cell division protein ZapE
MSPASAYRSALQRGFEHDRAQAAAVAELERLHHDLVAQQPQVRGRGRRLLDGLLPWSRRGEGIEPELGLYLWGGVGRGKTWLMDLLFETLPFPEKRRLHFHRFMQAVHADLTRLKGRTDPLQAVARDLASETRVLCLDEMQVNDITDAMIMAGLLTALFAQGVTLVTTANVPPAGLYRAGLQRDRFLPAIALLERHCRVLELASPTDYRLRRLEQAPVYLTPLGPSADTALARAFADLSGPGSGRSTAVTINDREIPVVAWSDGVIWLDFDVICHIPRSKLDYVELARCFHTLLLSNVRRLSDEQSNIVTRLITLVDAVYDRNTALILSAEAAPPELYRGRDLAFEFRRTSSRLVEMQSHAYLARAHLA